MYKVDPSIDILNKRAAQVSKAIRTLGLRIIPGDLQDEAEEIIKSIRLDEAARDPDGERKRMADAFGEIGVKATELAEYLGHGLDTCSPAEIVNLRGIYGAICNGESSWKSVMDNKVEQSGKGGSGETIARPKELPTCNDETFEKKKGGWRMAIETGNKSVNDLIAMIQTKEMLTNEQKLEIASWANSGSDQ